uniref:Putative secreted protein n=1 Tax=Anopheles darlingi TaxID=43151 RepID=A0A2M4DDG4_ANODA
MIVLLFCGFFLSFNGWPRSVSGSRALSGAHRSSPPPAATQKRTSWPTTLLFSFGPKKTQSSDNLGGHAGVSPCWRPFTFRC